MKIRLVCCALLGLLISPAMATIAVTLEPTADFVGDVYADIPWSDAIVAFGMDAIPAGPDLSYASFAPAPGFDVAPTADGDGFSGFIFPPGSVYGDHVLLGTLTFTGTADTFVQLGATDGDLTEGFGLLTGGFAEVTYGGAIITVPEPAALVLLALGALALRRR